MANAISSNVRMGWPRTASFSASKLQNPCFLLPGPVPMPGPRQSGRPGPRPLLWDRGVAGRDHSRVRGMRGDREHGRVRDRAQGVRQGTPGRHRGRSLGPGTPTVPGPCSPPDTLGGASGCGLGPSEENSHPRGFSPALCALRASQPPPMCVFPPQPDQTFPNRHPKHGPQSFYAQTDKGRNT